MLIKQLPQSAEIRNGPANPVKAVYNYFPDFSGLDSPEQLHKRRTFCILTGKTFVLVNLDIVTRILLTLFYLSFNRKAVPFVNGLSGIDRFHYTYLFPRVSRNSRMQ